jgi:hypothetical protein
MTSSGSLWNGSGRWFQAQRRSCEKLWNCIAIVTCQMKWECWVSVSLFQWLLCLQKGRKAKCLHTCAPKCWFSFSKGDIQAWVGYLPCKSSLLPPSTCTAQKWASPLPYSCSKNRLPAGLVSRLWSTLNELTSLGSHVMLWFRPCLNTFLFCTMAQWPPKEFSPFCWTGISSSNVFITRQCNCHSSSFSME